MTLNGREKQYVNTSEPAGFPGFDSKIPAVKNHATIPRYFFDGTWDGLWFIISIKVFKVYLLFSESILGLYVSIKLVPKAVVIAAWYKMFNTNNCKKHGRIKVVFILSINDTPCNIGRFI